MCIRDSYLDGRIISLDPLGAEMIGRIFLSKLNFPFDKIGGPATAAIPLITALSLTARVHQNKDIPGFYIRSSAKEHGLTNKIEGNIKRGGTTYMIDTVEDIKKIYNKANSFSIIIGDDNLEDIGEWKDFNKLCELADFIVAPRKGTKKIKNQGFGYLNSKNLEVSSSQIRRKIKKNENWTNLVPETIIKYIAEKNLYK